MARQPQMVDPIRCEFLTALGVDTEHGMAIRWQRNPPPLLLALVTLLAAGCGGAHGSLNLDMPPLVLQPIQQTQVVDGRGRFREILLAVIDARSGASGGDPTGERLLFRLAGEPPPSGAPVHLGPARTRLRVLVVPGMLGDLVSPWVMPYAHGLARLEALGFRTGYLMVSGRASCEYNAERLRAALTELDLEADEQLLLVGYSKGAVDVLEALVRYPEFRARVTAVLSVVGAIGGSPVADETSGALRSVFRNLPLVVGERGDGGGLASMERATRMKWLARHELPSSVHYFSLGAFAERERISTLLREQYDDLAVIDPRNDGNVLFYDQVIPRGTLLGFVNADHWAVALPFEQDMPAASMLVDRNEFPRELVLEAAVRFVEEFLLNT